MPIPGVFPGAVAAAAGVAGAGGVAYDPWCGLYDLGPFFNGNQHDHTITMTAPPGPNRFIVGIAHWRLSNTFSNTTTYVNGEEATILQSGDNQGVSTVFWHPCPTGSTCVVRLECLPTELNASTVGVWNFANAAGEANPINHSANAGSSHPNANLRSIFLFPDAGDYVCLGTGAFSGTDNITDVAMGSATGELIEDLAEILQYRTSFMGFKYSKNYPNINGGSMQPSREHTPSGNRYIAFGGVAVKGNAV